MGPRTSGEEADMAMQTLIVVVGGDYLALEICREILRTTGYRTVLVWGIEETRDGRKFAAEARALDDEYGDIFTFLQEDPAEPGALEHAGLRPPEPADERNCCLVAVSVNDRLNLRVALAARDIDSDVQITLRQFNPLLGRKIQEGLRYKCIAISPAAHAAATYAAAAVDPSCGYAMPFPTLETLVARIARRRERAASGRYESAPSLFGFSERSADDFGIVGLRIAEAEQRLRARVVGVNGDVPYLCAGELPQHDEALLERPLEADDRVCVFGAVRDLRESWEGRRGERLRARARDAWREFAFGLRRTEPILRGVVICGAVLYVAFVAYFAHAMHLNVLASMYYVLTTMTTVGYGDITPCHDCASTASWTADSPLFVAMLTMLVGVLLFAVLTATVTSTLNSAQTRRLSGLRKIHRSGHVIVCGSGNVGSLVIDYLRDMGEQVVVVERNPDALLVELARERSVDLLTGDATSDETIAYCAPERAKALVGVTNSDTANLEAALGARSRERRDERPLNVVLRIDDPVFGRSIERHFGITSFSTTELTAPTIAGLARFESTRGRFDLFSGRPYARLFQLAERVQSEKNEPPPAPPDRPSYRVQWVPLYVWREDGHGRGKAIPIHAFTENVLPGDRLLAMIPLDQFS